jgi:hypothetical protein
MYERPGIDLTFRSSGDIERIWLSVYTPLESNGDEYKMGNYWIKNNSLGSDDEPPLSLAISLHESITLAKPYFPDVFDYGRFLNFCEWMSDRATLQSILDVNEVVPAFYDLSSDNCLREYVEDPNIHVTYMLMDADGVRIVDPDEFDIHETYEYWLRFWNAKYYLITPYYESPTHSGGFEKVLSVNGKTYMCDNLIVVVCKDENASL